MGRERFGLGNVFVLRVSLGWKWALINWAERIRGFGWVANWVKVMGFRVFLDLGLIIIIIIIKQI